MDTTSSRVSITINAKTYKELLVLLGLGAWVKEKVFEAEGKSLDSVHDAVDEVLEAAHNTDASKHVRTVGDWPTHSAWIEKEIAIIMDRFIDDEFWHELAVRLAQRDFLEDMTGDEEQALTGVGGRFSGRIDALFEQYEGELDAHGIERLHIEE